MIKQRQGRLYGLKEISGYLGRNARTVTRYRRELGLPLEKIGGVWEADVQGLEEWRRDQATEDGRRRTEDGERKTDDG